MPFALNVCIGSNKTKPDAFFENRSLFELSIDNTTIEPDLELIFIKRVPEIIMPCYKDLYDTMQIEFKYFLKGVMHEFGNNFFSIQKDLNKAFDFYRCGAELNEPYCNFRLYYIFRCSKNYAMYND